jgi:hypothetical protein
VLAVAFRVQVRNFLERARPASVGLNAGTADMLPHATGSSGWQIRRMRLLPQSYAGKRPIRKWIRRIIRRVMMCGPSCRGRTEWKIDASRRSAARSAARCGCRMAGARNFWKARSLFLGSTCNVITEDGSRRCPERFQPRAVAEEKRTASSSGIQGEAKPSAWQTCRTRQGGQTRPGCLVGE